jgi:hypothetical protein
MKNVPADLILVPEGLVAVQRCRWVHALGEDARRRRCLGACIAREHHAVSHVDVGTRLGVARAEVGRGPARVEREHRPADYEANRLGRAREVDVLAPAGADERHAR